MSPEDRRAAQRMRSKGSKVKFTKNTYTLVIKLYAKYPKGNMKAATPAWVHCSCPYFKYYVEVADAARGSSAVITSNGSFPKIRNPRMRPYLCKHLLAAVRAAMRMKPKPMKITEVRVDEMERLATLLHQFIPGAKPLPPVDDKKRRR